jgi:hypothetical protein
MAKGHLHCPERSKEAQPCTILTSQLYHSGHAIQALPPSDTASIQTTPYYISRRAIAGPLGPHSTQTYKSNPPLHPPPILFLTLNCLQEAFQVDQIVPMLLSISDTRCVTTALVYMTAGPLFRSVSGIVREELKKKNPP